MLCFTKIWIVSQVHLPSSLLSSHKPKKMKQLQGVHVFLDMHQDAFSTTNGGEGIPYWVAADFQEISRGCRVGSTGFFLTCFEFDFVDRQ